MSKEMVCIVCPLGCRMTLSGEGESVKVEGNSCLRGKEYAVRETTFPTRMLQTTVTIYNAPLCRLPVRTSSEIPKGAIMDCMVEIKAKKVSAPVKRGDIIISDVAGTGVDIVASRTMAGMDFIIGAAYSESENCQSGC